MNVLSEVRKRPVASGITLVGAAGAIVLFMNVMPAMELIVRIKKAPDVADAAMGKAVVAEEKAGEAREWIDRYIADQQKQRAFDQELAEREAEFQRQMLELQRQQQQAPNQAAPRQQGLRECDENGCWQMPNSSPIRNRVIDLYEEENPVFLREWEGDECWECPSTDRDWCWDGHWERCDE